MSLHYPAVEDFAPVSISRVSKIDMAAVGRTTEEEQSNARIKDHTTESRIQSQGF